MSASSGGDFGRFFRFSLDSPGSFDSLGSSDFYVPLILQILR